MSDHYETRCPSCGGSDEQGCYADCPTHHITALEARVRELEGHLSSMIVLSEAYTTIMPQKRSHNVDAIEAARAALNQEKQK